MSEIWTDFWSRRQIKARFQAKGARPWPVERRSGLARVIYSRLAAGGRFPGGSIVGEIHFCFDTLLSLVGQSAY